MCSFAGKSSTGMVVDEGGRRGRLYSAGCRFYGSTTLGYARDLAHVPRSGVSSIAGHDSSPAVQTICAFVPVHILVWRVANSGEYKQNVSSTKKSC
jgi:hypothetical protein